MSPIEEILQTRRKKIEELKRRGIELYPARFSKTHWAGEILEKEPSGNLATAGRLVQIRRMGKASFAHLKDHTGKIQIYLQADALGQQSYDLFQKDIHLGDFVGVSGSLFRTKTGELTLKVQSLKLLCKILRPLPEKWHGLKDIEARSRQRALDLLSNPSTQKLFENRSRILQSLRATLGAKKFLEVETPVLQSQAGGACARPFATLHKALGEKLYLRIALELHLKRLLVGGLERVYELGKCFRNEGVDSLHNPEFTMLEAYQAYADYRDMMELAEELVRESAVALGRTQISYRGREVSLDRPFQKERLPELWEKYCGEKLALCLDGKSLRREGLLKLAEKNGLEGAIRTPEAKLFERIFEARILPHLTSPTFVLDYPTAVSPLAKQMPENPSLVERFELFLAQEEVCNAFTELNDPLEQRERFLEQARQRQGGDEEAQLLDEDFVETLEYGMPPAGGLGLGVDRLTMILTGTESIRDVILFPILRSVGT